MRACVFVCVCLMFVINFVYAWEYDVLKTLHGAVLTHRVFIKYKKQGIFLRIM